MIKVVGTIVYSTCSMNPIENEAVVAEIIRRSEGAMRLVDVSDQLSELKRNPGITTWMMQDRDGAVYNSFDEVPEEKKKYIVESMFPPKDIMSFGMSKCLRIYPHLQNTGGFFVSVLEKIAPLPKQVVKDVSVAKDEEHQSVEIGDDEAEHESKRPKMDDDKPKQTHIAWTSREEKPFIFLNPDHELIINARYFFQRF